ALHADAPIGFATFDPKGLRFAWLRGAARERDVGVFGPFGVAHSARGSGLGAALLRLALANLRERGFARALIAAVGSEELIRYYRETVGARVLERFDVNAWAVPPPRAVVMVSGNGTNLQAVLDGARAGVLPIDVAAVVSNNSRAYANERARRAGTPLIVLPWNRKEEARDAYDDRLMEAMSELRPDLVLLLGWMHLLPERFVRTFPSLLNLHPAFLPLDPERDDVVMPDGTRTGAFRGPHAVAAALAAGSAWVGATVHAVTPSTDRGPVMARKPMRVASQEREGEVIERLHRLERDLVAVAVTRWLYER
ncbi:MAG: GNAT family N-acetyltransferase, partial [Candidatus Eremiobacteraeota bacterium]|nr:GNAT family N-acetyltransferase [Candidatus Eremiobacteraeota bacterium]